MYVTVAPEATREEDGAPMLGVSVYAGRTNHLAYSVVAEVIGVVKENCVVKPASKYQPLKVNPLLVGTAGSVTNPPETINWTATVAPPVLVKLTAQIGSTNHLAYSTVAVAIGAVKTNSVFKLASAYQPLKVNPLLLGTVGVVATPPEVISWSATLLPPLLVKLTV